MTPLSLLAAAFLAATVALPTHRVQEPIAVLAPDMAIERWNGFEGLPATPSSGISLRITNAPSAAGRIDVLRRDASQWVWVGAYRFQTGAYLPPSPDARAVLVRFESSPVYYWCEIAPRSPGPVQLLPRKNLVVDSGSDVALVALFLPSESQPRILGPRERTFRQLPAESAILCANDSSGSICTAVQASSSRAHLSTGRPGGARVIRVEPSIVGDIQAFAESRIAIRPKQVALSRIAELPWVALTFDDEKTTWEQVVLDRAGDGYATTRINGAALAALPLATSFALEPANGGLVVRPWVGTEKHALSDPSAMLVAFIATAADSIATTPLATATLAPDGDFHLPKLGSGSYTFKLLSSESSSDRVTVSALAGATTDIVFPAGPSVHGRIVRLSGGPPTAPPSVELSLVGSAKDVMAKDPVDSVRFATASDYGDFRVVLTSAGTYRLAAHWGNATAAREFTVPADAKEIDIGQITLENGTTLHGTVAGCSNGQAILIAVPEISANVAPGLADLRRVAIAGDGHFIADGLTVGRWSVMFQCGQRPHPAVPPIVTVADTNDIFLTFSQEAAAK